MFLAIHQVDEVFWFDEDATHGHISRRRRKQWKFKRRGIKILHRIYLCIVVFLKDKDVKKVAFVHSLYRLKEHIVSFQTQRIPWRTISLFSRG